MANECVYFVVCLIDAALSSVWLWAHCWYPFSVSVLCLYSLQAEECVQCRILFDAHCATSFSCALSIVFVSFPCTVDA